MERVSATSQPMTQKAFAKWVGEQERRGDINHYELLNGRVVMSPPAGWPHGTIGSRLGNRIGPLVERARLGQCFDSSQGFDLPSGDTVQPDFAFASNERWAKTTPIPGTFLKLVPDLLVEVLSRKTATRDRGEKKDIYARNGVREYWLIDSKRSEIQVFHLRAKTHRFGRATVLSGDDRVQSKVIPGVDFAASKLFEQ